MSDDIKLRSHRSDVSSSGAAAEKDAASYRDPLAELARLIGQNDLFEQMRRDAGKGAPAPVPSPTASAERAPSRFAAAETAQPGPRPAAVQPTAEPPREIAQLVRSPAARPAYAEAPATHAAHPEPFYADGPESAGNPAEYDNGHYDAAYDDLYEQDGIELPRRRRGLAIAAAAVGLAVVGTAGAFAYRAVSTGENTPPPVIQANTAPMKMVPAPQNRDPAEKAVFDRAAAEKAQPERVVPREEQPVDVMKEAKAAAPSRPNAVSSSGNSGSATPTKVASAAPSAGTASTAGEAKKVKTIPIRPDGSIATESAAARGQSARIMNSTQGRTNAQVASAAPMALAPEGEVARPPASIPTRTVSVAPSVTGSVASASNAHVVQLASQKTEAEAQASFKSLQAKYPSVLGGRQPLIRRVELGDKGTYYRAQVGPFASAEQANELCGSLKAAGGQCIVQKN